MSSANTNKVLKIKVRRFRKSASASVYNSSKKLQTPLNLGKQTKSENDCSQLRHPSWWKFIRGEKLSAKFSCITTEMPANKMVLVEDKMLTYRGKGYSLMDIASQWKKDYRTWLWKNKASMTYESVGAMYERLKSKP